MKIIAIEEHFLTRAVRDAWAASGIENALNMDLGEIEDRLDDLTDTRIQMMDASGVDVQVLSLNTPALHNLEPAESEALARQTNDLIAATIARRPDRFDGFATLPISSPKAAARELERAVETLGLKGAMLCGRTREKNLDHPNFLPVFEAAASLRVPLYIHPQIPQKAVCDVYYSGFDPQVDVAFAAFGLGWHYEAGIQFVRLALAGTFDRFPDLQMILGHWGEVVLFYTERLAALQRVAKLQRSVVDCMKQNLYVTPSGMFSQDYMQRSIDVVGIDRILFSTDYPYEYKTDGGARKFIEAAALSDESKQKIAHGNWERLIATKI